ncbi:MULTISPECIES: sigma-70 family RNA polymerase sigma factor [unclassified Variovorax]|uniref:sigma-70 family RNA polymerase sigma factor n=1 Tax=unclassified Variovorax TaxID=663243 RepID=UPI00076D57EE|nr:MULTISPECIES: sigma-70 family RNA polymerase sigma factor [unclassified Variovorax]KWT65758.1 RNA polymerase sigma-54 factor RpoN [Variovorax sp. WDL1]PNG56785.1 ECF RNA polymerase sigma factor EcfG [Variovorax sp. B4]PNG58209.1 ECF RNA polymerase sigma factor EcfG [Variovorax sp. B2]VTV09282.1 RNA polymerase sigma factor SigM [Variovorax sp. WDL1]
MDSRALIDHIPSLRRYARALTGDAWAADDLVQDTLERACRKWQLWIVGSDLRAWLFTIMHNVFASQMRRAPPRAVVDIDEIAAQLPGAGGARDRAIDLQRCLLLLPEEQRAALLLVALEDMSYAQLSRVLNVPLGTVMSRLARARVRLQELMEGAPPPAAGRPGLRRLK